MFPFYWNGTEYFECTDDDGDVTKWCGTTATEVEADKRMYHNWAYCGKEC